MRPGAEEDPVADRRGSWVPFLVRLALALLVLTPFIAIVIQALGKR
jgi:hypothetical protein